MKQYWIIFGLVCALAAALYSLFADGSYLGLKGLQRSVSNQDEKNEELQHKVSELKTRIHGLRTSDRELEKAARNELGMARPNELIFLFEKKKDKADKKDSKENTNDTK
jgi:cell division protein FtsB